MAPRETENNAFAELGVTNKEHYGMLWYFLERSILCVRAEAKKKNTKTSLAHVDTVILSRQHLRLTSALRDRDVFVT